MRRGALAALALFLAARPGAGDDGPTGAGLALTVPSNRFGAFELIQLDVGGKNPDRLFKERGVAIAPIEPTWSPGGRRVAFVSYRTGTSQLYMVDADGRNLKALTHTGFVERTPAFSPDGRKLAFCSSRDGNEEIYVMDSDGTGERNLSRHPARDADPAWSPDGKRLAFASNRGGNFRLYVMEADGTGPREFVGRDLFGWIFPAWSPDGKHLAYGAVAPDNSYQLFLADLDAEGGREAQLTTEGALASYAAWSPDGRYLAYVRFRALPPGLQPGAPFDANEAGGELMVCDLDARTHARISAGDLPIWGPRPAWKPNTRLRPPGP